MQAYLREGKLSAGHARALITSDDPAALARRVIQKNLSVRETEKLARSGLGTSGGARSTPRPASTKDADTKALEGDLSANLGMKVSVDHNSGQENGQITIKYNTLDDLDNLCRILSSNN